MNELELKASSSVQRIADIALSHAEQEPGSLSGSNIVSFIGWMAKAGDLAPPWWSESRDVYLSKFWKGSNHLSIALYNAQSKLAGIPFIIEPKDTGVSAHLTRAEELTEMLIVGSNDLDGIHVTLERFYEDLLTQDNGAFMEVIGDGPPDGPIQGTPYFVRHLDSQRCQRTGDALYPVIYHSTDGNLYKLHWSRVISMSQMTSSRREMHGVGLCAVSRALDIAQSAIDVVRYKQERLGSRPPSQILVGKGVSADAITTAIQQARRQMDNKGLTRYSPTVAIGSERSDIDIDILNMHHLEPFDEKTSIQLAMYAIAGAFGLDISEIWPVTGAASSTDAKIQHLRARGKLPAQVTDMLAAQFNTKFLPPYLKMRFDFRDDEEDQQRALIGDIRGRQRERDIGSGTLTVRTARQKMLVDGDIKRPMFESMEWSSGRLEDGSPIFVLFFDETYDQYLNLGVDNPLDLANLTPLEVSILRSAIAERRSVAAQDLASTRARGLQGVIHRALAALDWYEQKLDAAYPRNPVVEANEEPQEEEPEEEPEEEGQDDPAEMPDEEFEASGRSSMGLRRQGGMMKGVRNGAG